jgi:hypothetical protein
MALLSMLSLDVVSSNDVPVAPPVVEPRPPLPEIVGAVEAALACEAGKNDADKAFKHYETALAIFKEIDDRYYTARSYLSMGATALYRRQQPEAALKY